MPKPKKFGMALWLQLALLLTVVALTTLAVSLIIFEVYWSNVLENTRPDIRRELQNLRPSFGQLLDFQNFRFRPRVIIFIVVGLMIIGISILVSRRILASINALEKSVQRISSSAPLESNGFLGLRERIEHIAKRLETSENARRLANAAIAHEFRTPLSALRARVESLEYGVYPLEMAEIAKLHPNLDLLEHLVEDLRTLSLADVGELRLEPQKTDVSALIADVLLEVRGNIGYTTQPLEVWLDPKRIRQVLYNLLENAVRYTPDQTRIEVQVTAQAQEVQIVVADAGQGVAEEHLPHLFTPFYRLEPSRSREMGGSGLGLAVVQAIVQAHGGSVHGQRAALGGLEVVVRLPHGGRLTRA
jgi:two-component system, OmpR family, sensor histidine kinase BaeS